MITYEDGSQESYLTVDPSAFTYMLINAVKEQQKKIDELETKVLEMEMLKQELEQIKSHLLSKEE
jgi:trimeric autotransporter adhesin